MPSEVEGFALHIIQVESQPEIFCQNLVFLLCQMDLSAALYGLFNERVAVLYVRNLVPQSNILHIVFPQVNNNLIFYIGNMRLREPATIPCSAM